MSAPATKVFGRGLARAMQALFVLQIVAQVLGFLSDRRSDLGWDWLTVARPVLVVLLLAGIAFMETSIVRVGPERIRWRSRLGRRIDLALDDVADVRRHPTKKNRVQLVTTDGQVLPLPVQRDDGPKVWWHLFGDRPAEVAPHRG